MLPHNFCHPGLGQEISFFVTSFFGHRGYFSPDLRVFSKFTESAEYYSVNLAEASSTFTAFFAAVPKIKKIHFAKKKWAKSTNFAKSRFGNNLQPAIQGCHCQLDDQCRGPSIKEKDHLDG